MTRAESKLTEAERDVAAVQDRMAEPQVLPAELGRILNEWRAVRRKLEAVAEHSALMKPWDQYTTADLEALCCRALFDAMSRK